MHRSKIFIILAILFCAISSFSQSSTFQVELLSPRESVIIPAEGGYFRVDLRIIPKREMKPNGTLSFDFQTNIVNGFICALESLTFSSRDTILFSFVQFIPGNANGGEQEYIIELGTVYRDTIDFKWEGEVELSDDNTDQADWQITIIDPATNINQTFEPMFLNDTHFPNPFGSATNLRFVLINPEFLSIEVYDPDFHRIASKRGGWLDAGLHYSRVPSVGLTNRDSGVYFYKLTVGNTSLIRKFIVLK